MITRYAVLFITLSTISMFCTTPVKKDNTPQTHSAVAALKSGDFYLAHMLANDAIALSRNDSLSHLVRAITQYYITSRRLGLELRSNASSPRNIDVSRIRHLFSEAESDLSRVSDDLDIALRDRNISLELTPSAWQCDWNMDGDVDDDDARLFQVEHDENGGDLPDDDPRRTPTIRFDYADVQWASAYIHFHRAVFDLLLSYDWSVFTRLNIMHPNENGIFVIKLLDPGRIKALRGHLIAGLEMSNASRKSILAETDDDREWIPSPSQKSRALTLPMTKELFATWDTIVNGLLRICRGEEGLDITSVFLHLDREHEPLGCIDIGRMLSSPKDIEWNIPEIARGSKDNIDKTLSEIFGKFYRHDLKPSTAITSETLRMSNEVKSGSESFTDKLKYLIWIN
jgi:hypothetical protein